MNRQSHPWGFFAFGSLAFGLACATDASAQPAPPFVPPPAFVATAEPVYYEGHAAYWYGNHWYWRDPHGWHWYSNEPAFLHDRRGHAPPPRHYYERRR